MLLSLTAGIDFSAYASDGVYYKIMSLQDRFPNGRYWNHQVTNGNNNGDQLKARGDESYSNTITSTPCATHNGTASIGQYDCNYFDGGLQCWGFACKIFYETFGIRASSLPKRTDKNNISVGDYVRYGTDSNGHSAIVLTRNGDSITVVECNNGNYGGGCNIHWGGLSNISSVSYFKHSSNWDSINNSYHVEPQASFSDWSDDRYTFISSTNAAIGQNITTSGGSFTKVGMVLYDSSGNQLGTAGHAPTSGISKYYYNINTELGCTLTPNTTYKYRFYAVVGGKTIYSGYKSFTTGQIVFSDWWNDNYTYIGTTDASIGQDITATGDAYTNNGMILYNAVGEQLASVSQTSTAGYTKYYFKINEELHYTLTPGTTYKYRFFAVVNNQTYYSEYKSFTTVSASKVNITWSDNYNIPSGYSAYVSAKAIAPSAGTFSCASIKIWDNSGKLIASKTEEPFASTKSALPVYYDIYSETGVLLEPATTYQYQLSVTFNGYTYSSPTYTFNTESNSNKRFGIDVSAHQGNIDWTVVSQNVDYVIIRCGFGSDYTVNDDAYWEYNASECERLGIPYGVYLYSYAENDSEAASEAAHVLRLLKGHKPTLPIYYDLEDNNTVGKQSAAQIYKQAGIFCNTIENSGYKAGVYANQSWWNNKLIGGSYDNWSKWIAVYKSTSNVLSASKWDIWQYTSSGKVPGINGSVDLDYSSSSFKVSNKIDISPCKVSGIKAKTYTGKALNQNITVKLGSTTLKNGTDYAITYKNNKNVGTSTVTITGKGSYTGTIKKNFKVNPKTTKLSKVTSPMTKQIKVSWKKQTNQTTGYQIQYSTSSKFSKKTTMTVTVKKNKSTSTTIKKLKAKKKYYIRIRTYKTVNGKKYYSAWSAKKTITTKK